MLAQTTDRSRNIQVFLFAGLLIILLLSFSLEWGSGESTASIHSQKASNGKFLPHIANPFKVVHSDAWEFDVDQDGDNFGLSHSQCSTAFPKLYDDIDEMVSRRKTSHVAKEDFDSVKDDRSSIRAMIHSGELYIITDGGLTGHQSRGFATVHAINRALLAFPARARLPNCEFRLYAGDNPGERDDTLWVFTKSIDSVTDNLWLMPDFGMYGWPEAKIGSYTQSRRDMRAVEEAVPWEQKTQKLIWRGFIFPHYRSRIELVNIARDKPWADILEEHISQPDGQMIPVADFCRWMFLADAKGESWSGGSKYKHNCHSVYVSHPLAWREIYTGVMEDSGPGQNWVSVRDDWSNLEETMQELIADPAKAKRIADNSVRTLRDRYLTPAAEACYWRRLIEGYASVSFEPDFYEKDNVTQRGTPFASVALMGKVEGEPH